MHIVLYNPLCGKNSGFTQYLEFVKKLEKKKIEYKGYDLLDLEGEEQKFIKSLNGDDVITIIGGDGTLSKVVNAVRGIEIKNKIYFCKAGTGNDFARCYKSNHFEITNVFNNFPVVKVDDKELKFLNGVGIGIDAAVCKQVKENIDRNVKESYFKVSRKVFKTFKPFDVKVTIDEDVHEFNNVWLCVAQNGKYFGGGMKIAPNADREKDTLDVVIVHKIKLFKLLVAFPLIFLGKHTMLKKSVFMCKGKNITLEPLGYDKMQHDGEVIEGISKIVINATK